MKSDWVCHGAGNGALAESVVRSLTSFFKIVENCVSFNLARAVGRGT
jgi:hypothetical protein